jgi:Tfp pilus assembly protein PilX
MTMPPTLQQQRGITLVIALIFLVILTLFAISGVNTGIVNLRTANNQQMMIEAESAAQQQIEGMLNSVTPFENALGAAATTANVDANGDGFNDFAVVTQPPKCLNIVPAPGYSYEFAASAPKDTVWEVIAAASDNVFGTSVTLRQGVKIRMKVSAVCVN